MTTEQQRQVSVHTPRLQGNPHQPRRRQIGDEPTIDVAQAARTDDEIAAAIRSELTEGPLSTGRLKGRIGTSDARLNRCLESLRRAGEIKRGGKRVLRWSLMAWDGFEPVTLYNKPVIIPKAVPASSSWWMGADRDEFRRLVREHAPRMAGSQMAAFVRPMVLA